MIEFFNVERVGDGYPKFEVPRAVPPTERQAFERRCYLNGVTEPGDVAALWAEQVAKRVEAASKAGKGKAAKRRGRRGRR